MSSMIKKYLADLSPWIVVSWLFGIAMVWINLPTGINDAAAMKDTLLSQLGLTAGMIAFCFGLIHASSDLRIDRRGFLLHRLLDPHQIFWARTVAGFLGYWITLLVPILFAASHLAGKGLDRMPTSAWQLVPLILYCFFLFLLHPAATWVINRNARLLGTRSLPIVGVVGALVLVRVLVGELNEGLSVLLPLAIGGLGFITIVLFASKHAFTSESFSPPSASKRRHHWSATVGLALSSVAAVGVLIGMFFESMPRDRLDTVFYSIVLDSDDGWCQLKAIQPAFDRNELQIAKRALSGEGKFKAVAKDWQQVAATTLSDFPGRRNRFLPWDFQQWGSFRSEKLRGRQATVVAYLGRLLVYDGSERLRYVATPDGVFGSYSEATGSFAELSFPLRMESAQSHIYSSNAGPIFCSQSGVYQLEAQSVSIRRLVDEQVDAAGLRLSDGVNPASFWTLNDKTLTTYQVQAVNENEQLPVYFDQKLPYTLTFEIPTIKLSPAESFEIAPLKAGETISIIESTDGAFSLTRRTRPSRTVELCSLTNADDGDLSTTQVQLPADVRGVQDESWIALAAPPGLLAVAASISYLMGQLFTGAEDIWWIVATGFLNAFVSMIAVSWLTRQRDLEKRSRIAWTIASGFLGLGAILAIIAIYPKPVRDECAQCGKPRRIDQQRCEHCEASWESSEHEGFEVFDFANAAETRHRELVS